MRIGWWSLWGGWAPCTLAPVKNLDCVGKSDLLHASSACLRRPVPRFLLECYHNLVFNSQFVVGNPKKTLVWDYPKTSLVSRLRGNIKTVLWPSIWTNWSGVGCFYLQSGSHGRGRNHASIISVLILPESGSNYFQGIPNYQTMVAMSGKRTMSGGWKTFGSTKSRDLRQILTS